MEKQKLSTIIITLESGTRPKGGAIEDGVPSIGAEHLNDIGGFRLDKMKYIPKSFYEVMKNGKISNGDILIVKDGATTGKTSLVDDDFPFKNAAINEHVFLVRIDKLKGNSKYVFHFLKSKHGQIEIKKDFRGATVGGISRKFINLVSIRGVQTHRL